MENKTPGSNNYSQNSTGGCNYYYSTPQWPQQQPYYYDYYYWPQQPIFTPSFNVRKTISKIPEAFITVDKSRVKMFSNKCYIKDETDFEIELFNPSTETVGVKFKMNGEYISESHLVLRPGKRMFLDRYINDKKKFRYTTYTVENSKESKDAIALNGNISVEFYREYQSPAPAVNAYDNILRSSGTKTVTIADNNVNCFYSANSLTNFAYTDNVTLTTSTSDVIGNNSAINNATFKGVFTDEIETGMVAKGGDSETEFDSVDIDFEYTVIAIKEFKIMPHSQKPIEGKDLVLHCTNCGKKQKKDSKFCFNCGTQI